MSDLVNRLRLQAEDLHSLNPASETVKCLSLGADEIERLRAENTALRARVKELEEANQRLRTVPMKYRRMEFNAQLQQEVQRLRAENARMKAELKSIEGALDDPRANLTLTTAEIIRELKAQLATSPLPLTQG